MKKSPEQKRVNNFPALNIRATVNTVITRPASVAAHRQYQNLLTLAELFLVGLITSAARIRSGGLLLVLLHMEATTLVLLFG